MPTPRRLPTLAVTILLLAGCTAPGYRPAGRLGAAGGGGEGPRDLPCFAADGRTMAWADVMDAVRWADVVLLGERHDDATGHAVQRAVVEDAVARWNGVVLSLEMLERDEQPIVDDYFEGIIDADQFARLTHSESWAGDGSWADWYQPIIDAARDGGGRVVAANAPRRYVRLARTDGYGRLSALPSPRRQWVDYPSRLPDGPYWERFKEVMTTPPPPAAEPETETETGLEAEPGTDTDLEAEPAVDSEPATESDAAPPTPHVAPAPHGSTATAPEGLDDAEDDGAEAEDAGDEDDGSEDAGAEDDGSEDAGDEDDGSEDDSEESTAPVHHEMTEEEIRAIFRSQLVWDATMASSIARSLHFGASKVIHLVGGFHCDFEGGTVLELRRRRPGARVLVISLVPVDAVELREEDRGRADIVVYTGAAAEAPPPE